MLAHLIKQSTATLSGYKWGRCHHILTLAQDGRFVSFTTPEEPLRVLLPLVTRTSNTKPHSGIDNFEYSFGFVPPFDRQGKTGVKHDAFCKMLKSVAPLPVPTAYIRFLQRQDRPLLVPIGITTEQIAALLGMNLPQHDQEWSLKKRKDLQTTPLKDLDANLAVLYEWQQSIRASIEAHPNPAPEIQAVTGTYGDIVLVRVDGHDDDWLQSDIMQTYHWGDPKIGQCSVTGKTGQALVTSTGSIKGASLISFNRKEVHGYGRTGYDTTPISREAATGIASGLTHILDDVSVSAHGYRLMLWRDDRTHEKEFLRAILYGSDEVPIPTSERPCHFLMLKMDGKVWRVCDWQPDLPLKYIMAMSKALAITKDQGIHGLVFLGKIASPYHELDGFLALLWLALRDIPLPLTIRRLFNEQFTINRPTNFIRHLIDQRDPMTLPRELDAAYRLGCWFGRMDAAHHKYLAKEERESKSLEDQYMKAMLDRPADTYGAIAERMYNKTHFIEDLLIDGPVPDLQPSDVREAAADLLDLPPRFTPAQKGWFIRGYAHQKSAIFAKAKTKKAPQDSSQTP